MSVDNCSTTSTGYTALYTCFNNWLQSVSAGTGYTAFFNNCLQSVPTGIGYTALYTCFNNWLQSVPAGTGYTALCTCFNLPVTKYTNRVLATQSLLYSASPQLVKKKKLAKYRPVDVKCIGDPSLPVFCRLQRITGYSKVPGMESWYRTELPKVNLVTENS